MSSVKQNSKNFFENLKPFDLNQFNLGEMNGLEEIGTFWHMYNYFVKIVCVNTNKTQTKSN